MYYLFPNILKYKIYIKNYMDFCYFSQPFCHKIGYMLICRKAEGVHC